MHSAIYLCVLPPCWLEALRIEVLLQLFRLLKDTPLGSSSLCVPHLCRPVVVPHLHHEQHYITSRVFLNLFCWGCWWCIVLVHSQTLPTKKYKENSYSYDSGDCQKGSNAGTALIHPSGNQSALHPFCVGLPQMLL